MNRSYLPPLAVLALLLGFSLWTGTSIGTDTQRWQQQLEQADALAQQESWTAAEEALSDSYRDWTARQSKLHILLRHDAIDDAEAMYLRAMAFAATPAGQQLIRILQQKNNPDISKAAQAAASGNAAQAKDALSSLLSDPQIQQLLKQFGG